MYSLADLEPQREIVKNLIIYLKSRDFTKEDIEGLQLWSDAMEVSYIKNKISIIDRVKFRKYLNRFENHIKKLKSNGDDSSAKKVAIYLDAYTKFYPDEIDKR